MKFEDKKTREKKKGRKSKINSRRVEDKEFVEKPRTRDLAWKLIVHITSRVSMAHAPYQPLSPVEEAMRRETEATLVTPEHGKWWGKCCKREHASKIILVVFVVGLFSYIAVDTFTTQYILGWMLDLNRFIQNSGDKGVLYLATMLFFLTILGIPATIFIVGESSNTLFSEAGSSSIPVSPIVV
jgi:hypothetical protein